MYAAEYYDNKHSLSGGKLIFYKIMKKTDDSLTADENCSERRCPLLEITLRVLL